MPTDNKSQRHFFLKQQIFQSSLIFSYMTTEGFATNCWRKLGLLAQHQFYCSKICSSPDVLLSLALGHMLGSELFYLFVHSPYICSHLTYVLRTDGRSAERPTQACSSFNASTHIRSPSSSLPKQLRLPRVTSIETIFCLFCGGTSEAQQVWIICPRSHKNKCQVQESYLAPHYTDLDKMISIKNKNKHHTPFTYLFPCHSLFNHGILK